VRVGSHLAGDRVGWPRAQAGRIQRRTANADERRASRTSDMASPVVGAIGSPLAFGVVFRPFNDWI